MNFSSKWLISNQIVKKVVQNHVSQNVILFLASGINSEFAHTFHGFFPRVISDYIIRERREGKMKLLKKIYQRGHNKDNSAQSR